jgi:hypothetical protein
MEALVVIMGLLGLAGQATGKQQQPQHFYNPQTGQRYIMYNGALYEQSNLQLQPYQTQQYPQQQYPQQQYPQQATYPQNYSYR